MENFNQIWSRGAAALLILLTVTFAPNSPVIAGESEFIAIAYHDVVDSREELASDGVTTDHLIAHFEWLLANQYHPISIDDLIAAEQGKKALPKKAVLLCWDDGYTSFYERVFPLLKAYHYPAVLALVGSWLEPEPSATVLYGDNKVPRTKFLTWQQIKELDQSGLVEIASHSYNLHKGTLADSAGDRLPAVITHIYDPKTKRYENDPEYYERIHTDLKKNNTLITEHLGHAPRVLVWPFGRYNSTSLRAAEQAGMDITLTLDPIPGDISSLQNIGRVYPTRNPGLSEFRGYLDRKITPPIRHFFKVDTAELIESSATQEAQFSAFLDRLADINPDMVTFAPTLNAGGNTTALFINDRFPTDQDRLTRLTWHTAHRVDTETFLWLSPSLFIAEPTQPEASTNTFFKKMGQSGFSAGVLVDYPLLTKELLQMATQASPADTQATFWNPAKRRRARQQQCVAAHPSITADAFTKLESYQYWQPFIEVGLVLSVDLLPELTTTTTSYLLTYFDFLLLDARSCNKETLESKLADNLQQLQRANLLAKISLLLGRDGSDQQLTRQLASLPRHNIINWGYEYENFLPGQPATPTIRSFMSKTSYPFK